MEGDAKVYAMIEELSVAACERLLEDNEITQGRTSVWQAVRDAYEAGTISDGEIVMEWDDDGEEESE